MTATFADALDALIDSPLVAPVAPPANYQPRDFSEPCNKCRGTGRFRSYSGRLVGECFACKGAGKNTFKTSPEARAKSRQGAQVRANKKAVTEAARIAAAIEAFKVEQPAVFAWMEAARNFPFAIAMREALNKWGTLTDNQLAACVRCVDGLAKAKAAMVERQAAAPEITIAKIEESFSAAKAHGIKRPHLRLDTFEFKPAGAASKNAGSIYVTEAGDYLGKITDGKFICTRECGDDRQARVVAAAADPAASAKAYGLRTGSCSCCGRTLTNGASIDLGIGPICAGKFGW